MPICAHLYWSAAGQDNAGGLPPELYLWAASCHATGSAPSHSHICVLLRCMCTAAPADMVGTDCAADDWPFQTDLYEEVMSSVTMARQPHDASQAQELRIEPPEWRSNLVHGISPLQAGLWRNSRPSGGAAAPELLQLGTEHERLLIVC